MVSFDQQDGDIWYNGALVPWKESKLHVLSHGLHYASCVFEGCRMYGGEIFKLREHSLRLIKSADEIEIMALAGRISAEAHVRAMQVTRPGRNEWEVAAEIERHFLAHRMVPGYTSIVGGGEISQESKSRESMDELKERSGRSVMNTPVRQREM